MTVTFELEGQRFMALNCGPVFKFSPAISFLLNCETQEEVDDLWEKLSERGEKEQCGWLKDKFDVSWQIVANVLSEMLRDEDAKSHVGIDSNEENRHTRLEEGIHEVIEYHEKVKTTGMVLECISFIIYRLASYNIFSRFKVKNTKIALRVT